MTDREFTQSPPSGVVTAMFTDMVGSTALKGVMPGETSAQRDAAFRETVKGPHDRLVLDSIRAHGGYLVNPTGDGFCATFVDTEEAVLCALEIQKRLADAPIPTPTGPLRLRIGLHTGMAGPESGDYTASTIDKTARIQGKAGPGQIFLSLQTYALVAGKVRGAGFQKAGTFDIKGMAPEELYVVAPAETLPAAGASLAVVSNRPTPSHAGRTAIIFFAGAAVFAALFILAPRLRTAPATPSTPSTPATLTNQTPLQPGRKWYGGFKFLPPMKGYAGSATLTVDTVTNGAFDGVYTTENDAWMWRVHGTIQGDRVRWDFVKPLKTKGSDDATGKASVECRLTGNRMTGLYKNHNDSREQAEITLEVEN